MRRLKIKATEEKVKTAVAKLLEDEAPTRTAAEIGLDEGQTYWIRDAIDAIQQGENKEDPGDWPEVRRLCWVKPGTRKAVSVAYLKWVAEAMNVELPKQVELRPEKRNNVDGECFDELPLEPKQEPKHTKLAQAFRLIAEWLEELDG